MLRSIIACLLALQAAAAATTPSISANSWGPGRIDLFGTAPNGSIWHKYYNEPTFEPSGFENFLGKIIGSPSAVSWAKDRVDYFVVGTNGSVYHRYWNGADGAWIPWPWHECLQGEDFVAPVGAGSWGEGRFDLVGLTKNGGYRHLYLNDNKWIGWEDFGINMTTTPSVVANVGTARFDVFGLSTNGTVIHKYWDGWQYQYEELSAPVKLISAPIGTSWGAGNLDLWALGEDGALYHNYWRPNHYGGWESLGGNFTDTPAVTHRAPGAIDIVGQFAGEKQYRSMYFNDVTWVGWSEKGGDYVSQPALVSEGRNIHVFGVASDGTLRWQRYMDAYTEWQPSFDSTWSLGNASDPFATSDGMEVAQSGNQMVMEARKQSL